MPDYEYINQTGVIVPDTSDILTDVQNEYKNAFGEDLIVDPSTPQGLLITAETLARDAVVRNNAALANQVNPNLAGGTFLDAICALTGLEREKATRSTVTAQLTGVPGSIIPEGVRATTASGDLFESIATVIIGVGGTITAPFRSVEFGPISAPVGALDQIVDGVLGWDTIDNSDAAVLGVSEQTDQSLRAKRKVTLALQGVSLSEAIVSGLYNTEGVKSLAFRENVTSSTAVIDTATLVAHSVYVCVDGGSDEDVAQTLLRTKSGGCAWNGTEEVEVIDQYSGQPYTVKFDRPEAVPFLVRTTVKVNSALINPTTAVREAIMAYVNGEIEGEAGLIVGQSVSVFELSGAVNRLTPGIYVQTMETSDDDGATWSADEIPITIKQIATIEPGDITVTVA